MDATHGVIVGLDALTDAEALRIIGTVATVRCNRTPAYRARWNQVAAVATAPHPDRTMTVVLSNLDTTDAALVNGLVQMLTNPEWVEVRDQVRAGTMGMTWGMGGPEWAPVTRSTSVLQDIEGAVCAVFGVSSEDLHGSGRMEPQAFARQVAMTLYREMTGFAARVAAEAFGRSDAGTVFHAAKAVSDRCDTNPHERRQVDAVRARLGLTATAAHAQEALAA